MNTLIKKNIEIDRAISEFRSGRPIIINKDNQYWLFFSLPKGASFYKIQRIFISMDKLWMEK